MQDCALCLVRADGHSLCPLDPLYLACAWRRSLMVGALMANAAACDPSHPIFQKDQDEELFCSSFFNIILNISINNLLNHLPLFKSVSSEIIPTLRVLLQSQRYVASPPNLKHKPIAAGRFLFVNRIAYYPLILAPITTKLPSERGGIEAAEVKEGGILYDRQLINSLYSFTVFFFSQSLPRAIAPLL